MAYQRLGVLNNYLCMCHELWEQADTLVLKGNHTGQFTLLVKIPALNHNFLFHFADYFIDLDRENGPITLHSSLNSVVKYVRAGIQKLRRNVNM